MNRSHYLRREVRTEHFSAVAGNAESGTEDRLRRSRSKRYDQFRPNETQLCLQPWPTGCDLTRVRLFVDPPFPARLPLEMFHRISDVNLFAVNAGFCQRPIHDLAGGPNERFARKILLIARLLADEHH